MALLFMDGFDAGDFAQKYNYIQGSSVADSLTRFSQGRSARMNGSGIPDGILKKFVTASQQITVGFAFRTNNALYSDDIFDIFGDSGSVTHLSLSINHTNQTFNFKRGTTVIATSEGGIWTSDMWYYLELQASIDDTNGSIELRQDGVEVLTYDGDTKNGGTSNDIDAVAIRFGGLTATAYYDDFYVVNSVGSAPYNSFLGDVRVQTLVPDGAGSSTQFTPSAGSNYETVDELPYSAADYVQSTTAGHVDLYTTTDIPTSSYVFAISNNVIAKKSDAGTANLRTVLKSSSTTVTSPTTTLGYDDKTITDIRVVDPDTSSSWSPTGVNAIESGMEVM